MDQQQVEKLRQAVDEQLGHPTQIVRCDDQALDCADESFGLSFSQKCLRELAANQQRWKISPGHAGECWITLSLDPQTGLGWRCVTDQAELSAKLATVATDHHLQQVSLENQTREIDSLAEQVMDDFEELALLRSLAESLPLLQDDERPGEIAKRFIDPLSFGLGAESLVAILASESMENERVPDRSCIEQLVWSGESFTDHNTLACLLENHAAKATSQPVIHNDLNVPTGSRGQHIREMIMIECRSENHLHGWLFAFNRVENESNSRPWHQHGFTTVQASLLQTATNQLAAQLFNARLFRQKEDLFTDVVRALVNAVEARDPYTCGHSERVASFARCLAEFSGRSPSECDRIYLTGLLHDVGKIAIPDGVLRKPDHLDQQERAIIETHTDAGWRILHELDALRNVLPGVLYHHEHFNGQGYPDGLAGEEIPWEGRVLAVCDAFDAMTSDRPYRKGMPIDKACEILQGGSGTCWDPKLIELFIKSVDEMDAIRIAHEPRATAVRAKPTSNEPSFAAAVTQT